MSEELEKTGGNGPRDPELARKMLRFPYPIVVAAAYVFLGFLTHLWHPLWMVFLTIPAYYQYASALKAKTRRKYLAALPVVPVSVILFLIAAFALHLWKFAWIVFVFDLLYYWYIGVNAPKTEE